MGGNSIWVLCGRRGGKARDVVGQKRIKGRAHGQRTLARRKFDVVLGIVTDVRSLWYTRRVF